MSLSLAQLGPAHLVSRKAAALRQIHEAIRLFFEGGDYVCSITLALAAEDQIPPTGEPHLWGQLMLKAPEESKNFNAVRNWLKHYREPEEVAIYKFEAAISVARATTKFIANYRQSTPQIESFNTWWLERYGFGVAEH